MPKQPRCQHCDETRPDMLDVHPGYIYCSTCGRRTLKGKAKVEVPVAGENAPPGYGHGV